MKSSAHPATHSRTPFPDLDPSAQTSALWPAVWQCVSSEIPFVPIGSVSATSQMRGAESPLFPHII